MAEYIEKQLVLSKSQQDYLEGRYDYDDFVLVSDIESIPPADVRPVVRGKWVVSRTDYGWNGAEFPTHCKCTECGREVPYQDKDNYCPNCGADMRGGDAE